jgi:hypothetical protein
MLTDLMLFCFLNDICSDSGLVTMFMRTLSVLINLTTDELPLPQLDSNPQSQKLFDLSPTL